MAITKKELRSIKKKLPRGAYGMISTSTGIPYSRIQSYFNSRGNHSEYELNILKGANELIGQIEAQKNIVKKTVSNILG